MLPNSIILISVFVTLGIALIIIIPWAIVTETGGTSKSSPTPTPTTAPPPNKNPLSTAQQWSIDNSFVHGVSLGGWMVMEMAKKSIYV